METGSVVTALVKEFTGKTASNMAIYCESTRISMRGGTFVLEIKDEIKNEYSRISAFKDEDAIIFLICEMLISTSTDEMDTCIMELKNKKCAIFDVKRSLTKMYRAKNEAVLTQFLKILESESSIAI